MKTEHPITPPPELVQQWLNLWSELPITRPHFNEWLSTQAARWGADQELEACCADIHTLYGKCRADWLRAARRPNPPSLKEQALKALASADGADHPVVATVLTADQHSLVRRALEALPDV